ncbi:hypothetical protein D9611_013868 [Ephemerocybe angulata]|uniref:Uncharacterized protein n=1 Tax=Ephemerocybe angulata TaxID=980116 RepID=A0A8H5FAB8_9AGAR|nr:hypothetical protein D9611_013868 [Tulosesus angulatus]
MASSFGACYAPRAKSGGTEYAGPLSRKRRNQGGPGCRAEVASAPPPPNNQRSPDGPTCGTAKHMSNPRRAAVYDLTGLRIHADGQRVSQTSNNPRARYWEPGATQDARGNWIARDAAGSLEVHRFVKRRKSQGEGEEDLDEDPAELEQGEEGEQEASGSGSTQTKKKSRKGKEREQDSGKEKRSTKRRKFQDDDFVKGKEIKLSGPRTAGGHELPSAELLTAIHHFASHHYAENGMLINSSKQYRLRRKNQREAKAKAKAKAVLAAAIAEDEANGLGSSSKVPLNAQRESDEEGDEGAEEEEEELNTDDEKEKEKAEPASLKPLPIDEPEAGSSRIKGPGRPKRSKQYRDMYKAMDGSALMAIGILCQEYVRHLVTNAGSHQEEGMTTSNSRVAQGDPPSSPPVGDDGQVSGREDVDFLENIDPLLR